MKKVIILIFLVFVTGQASQARSLYVDPQVARYKKYNPDGQKYRFVRSYINSLTYIHQNYQRNQDISTLNFEYLSNPSNVVKLRDDIVMNNINLRVARNFVKKYKDSQNGLILKVADLYTQFCDDLIALNNEEKEFYHSLYKKERSEHQQYWDKEEIVNWQQYINQERKDIMMGLLESAMLVSKVLISDKTDGYGELSYLGISRNQRNSLLLLLNNFEGDQFQGELREGQSFLGGSITILRDVLESDNYNTYY
jgi:hypothetical protein